MPRPKKIEVRESGEAISEPTKKLALHEVREMVEKAHKSGLRPGFAGQDLSGLDLSKLDLHASDFSGANLKMTSFAKANLQGSNFTDADREGADFTGADTRWAQGL